VGWAESKVLDEYERQMETSSTHLTPAEAGRLLGKSPAWIREMIRHGELTQERVAERWLIPVADIQRILHPSLAPDKLKKQAVPDDQKAKLNKKKQQGTLLDSTGSRSQSATRRESAAKETSDLGNEIERLETRMKQLEDELRDLHSGLLNDEKRERIEKLRREKRKHGQNLQKLQTELFRRDRSGEPRL
jgi:hypothetical protein